MSECESMCEYMSVHIGIFVSVVFECIVSVYECVVWEVCL